MESTESKFEFADRCGVSRSAITQAASRSLKEAMVGDRVRVTHPKAIAYLERCMSRGCVPRLRGQTYETPEAAPTKPSSKNKRSKTTPPKPEVELVVAPPVEKRDTLIELPKDVQEFLDWPLRSLYDKFGTSSAFNDFLTATKHIETINGQRLKNATTEGKLVSRELVDRVVFKTVDAAHTEMMVDGSRTIARRAMAIAEAGGTPEELEDYVTETLSKYIQRLKTKMMKVAGEPVKGGT